jgi:hypothetical protein
MYYFDAKRLLLSSTLECLGLQIGDVVSLEK